MHVLFGKRLSIVLCVLSYGVCSHMVRVCAQYHVRCDRRGCDEGGCACMHACKNGSAYVVLSYCVCVYVCVCVWVCVCVCFLYHRMYMCSMRILSWVPVLCCP